MTLTVGSLFSGIGGLELGLERAGMRTVWQVEADEYARRILRRHWPEVPKFSDVRNVGAHCLQPVDLICGGFPCQNISEAGKREGIEGESSGLWREFARIIRELKPRIVLVENVPALRGRGLDVVLSDLAESGFNAEWDCLPASSFGAPHKRDRLFLVAHARGQRLEVPEHVGATGGPALERGGDAAGLDSLRMLRGDVLPRSSDAFDVVSMPSYRGVVERPLRGGGPWASIPGVLRVADGSAHRMDRVRCVGNAVVPAVAEWVGRRILEAHP